MRQFKVFIFSFLIALFAGSIVYGQANASLNILTLNSGQVSVGSLVDVQVSIGNSGPGNIGVNKVRAQISIPIAIATAVPNGQQTGLPAGWIILANTGGSITICNGSDVILAGEQRQILIKIQGIAVGGPSTIAGVLSFGPGTAVCTGPGSLSGDNTADNTSTSSIQVNAAQACGLAVSASAGSILCNGGTTTLTAVVSNANGPVEYSITGGAPFQSSNTFTVSAGTYTVTAREVSTPLCSATSTGVVITQPAGISIATTAGTISCNGGTASLTVTASGGTAPLQYRINGGTFQVSNIFTVNASGSPYIVQVTDAQNCSSLSSPVNITEPPAASASVTAGAISCNGGNTTLTTSIVGGVAPYQYSLNGGALQSSNMFTVSAGTHIVSVTDANNCTVTAASLSITEPAAFTASASSGIIACNGGTTNLTVTSSGGTAPFQYSLDGGAFQSGNIFSVFAGSHVVTVRDANNCTVTTSALNVIQPSVLVVSSTAGSILCNGGSTSLVSNVTGGTAPYQYSLNGGTYQVSNLFTVDAAGSPYVVTVRDANNCTASSASIDLIQPSPIIATVTSTPVTIPGGSDATATVVVSGGIPPYTYSWNTTPVQTASTATGLAAGIYSVTVSDAQGCTIQATATINAPACAITASASAPGILCNGGTTTLTVTNAGGSAPFQYSLNGGPFQTSNVFTVGAGTYTVTVNDVNNCAVTTPSVAVTQPTPISANVSAGTISCNGGTTALTATATGGTAPYQYSLNSGAFQSSNIFTVVAGPYVVIVKDANDCQVTTTTVVVVEPGSISVALSAGTIGCNGGTTILTATATGGSAPYQYQLNGGVLGSGNTFIVASGTHNITVLDNNNCSSNATITITQPVLLSASVTSTNVTTIGGTDGTATVTPTGGTPPYNYSWSTSPVQTGNVATGLPAGVYSVIVTDFQNCTAVQTVTITAPVCNITATASAGIITCFGATAILTISVTGAANPVQYSLNGGPFQSANTFDVQAGSYVVTVRDASNCETTSAPVTIQQPAPIVISSSAPSVTCNGLTTAFSVSATGGTPPLEYSLNSGLFQSSNIFTVGAGTYIVTVKDAINCNVIAQPVLIVEPAPFNLIATAPRITECGGTTLITLSGTGGTLPYDFPAGNTMMSGPGTKEFSITDSQGCSASVSIVIEAPGCVELKAFPNPAQSTLNIHHSIAAPGALFQVYDMKGSLMISHSVGIGSFITELNVSKLSGGTYILIMWNNGERKRILFEKL